MAVKKETIDLGNGVRLRIGRNDHGLWFGAAVIRTGMGPIRVTAAVSERMLERQVLPYLIRLWREYRASVSGAAHVGLFGFIKKAWKGVKRVIRKVAKAKIIRRIGSTIKKIVNSPLVAKLAGLTKYVPVYGQAIHAGYEAVKKATQIAEGLLDKDKRALSTIKKLRAAIRNPRLKPTQRAKYAMALKLVQIQYKKKHHRRNIAQKLARGNQNTIRAVQRLYKLARSNRKRYQHLNRELTELRREYARQFGVGLRQGRISGGIGTYRDANGVLRWRQGYGNGYRETGVGFVGAMEGARYLWEELKPQKGVGRSFWRSSYMHGLSSLTH